MTEKILLALLLTTSLSAMAIEPSEQTKEFTMVGQDKCSAGYDALSEKALVDYTSWAKTDSDVKTKISRLSFLLAESDFNGGDVPADKQKEITDTVAWINGQSCDKITLIVNAVNFIQVKELKKLETAVSVNTEAAETQDVIQPEVKEQPKANVKEQASCDKANENIPKKDLIKWFQAQPVATQKFMDEFVDISSDGMVLASFGQPTDKVEKQLDNMKKPYSELFTTCKDQEYAASLLMQSTLGNTAQKMAKGLQALEQARQEIEINNAAARIARRINSQ